MIRIKTPWKNGNKPAVFNIQYPADIISGVKTDTNPTHSFCRPQTHARTTPWQTDRQSGVAPIEAIHFRRYYMLNYSIESGATKIEKYRDFHYIRRYTTALKALYSCLESKISHLTRRKPLEQIQDVFNNKLYITIMICSNTDSSIII